MSDEPLTDEEFRAAMMEFAIISDLRKQLAAAHSYIKELRKHLCEQTSVKIAEAAFGYEEPRVGGGWTAADFLPAVELTSFKKTNTDALQVTMFCADEEAAMWQDPKRMQDTLKRKLLDDLFCEMQKRGLFRYFQRRVDHETIYSIAIEVAKP